MPNYDVIIAKINNSCWLTIFKYIQNDRLTFLIVFVIQSLAFFPLELCHTNDKSHVNSIKVTVLKIIECLQSIV